MGRSTPINVILEELRGHISQRFARVRARVARISQRGGGAFREA